MAVTDREKRELTAAFAKSRLSLVDYRHILLHNERKLEVAPAPFHAGWSNILLNGKSNVAIQAFRESAKTQYCIRSSCLHALTFPSIDGDYLVILNTNQNPARTMPKSLDH